MTIINTIIRSVDWKGDSGRIPPTVSTRVNKPCSAWVWTVFESLWFGVYKLLHTDLCINKSDIQIKACLFEPLTSQCQRDISALKPFFLQIIALNSFLIHVSNCWLSKKAQSVSDCVCVWECILHSYEALVLGKLNPFQHFCLSNAPLFPSAHTHTHTHTNWQFAQ